MKKKTPLTTLLIFLCYCFLSVKAVSATGDEMPIIVKWYKNSDAATSLRFDDSHESHVKVAVPLLNTYDLKGTFMVNPGKSFYKKHKDSWEKQIPAMGHNLGNHTMNHGGARNLEEANYEIGETTRILRDVNLSESNLMVFASGGGKTWGGKRWSQADPIFHQLVEKFNLIDLYDGNHPSRRVDASSRLEELCTLLDATIANKIHQPFHFHPVGKTPLRERVKKLIRGIDLTVSKEIFEEFLQCITHRKDQLWVAPLIDILKYEEERKGAVIKELEADQMSYSYSLTIATDPVLYNHPLTMKVPAQKNDAIIKNILQDSSECHSYQSGEVLLIDIKPVNSVITIHYKR